MKKQLLFIILIAITKLLQAQPGSLDITFGVFGVTFSPFISTHSYGYGLAIQADEKIIVTGHTQVGGLYKAFVVRYDTNGTSDSSFPPLLTTIGAGSEYGRAVAIQPDGRIVVTGQIDFGNSDILVLRLTTTGGYDSTFGTGGVVTVDLQQGSDDQSSSLVIQPDGKILVAGWSTDLNKDIALLRLNPDGSVDTTFGNNGRVFTNLGQSVQQANAMKLQPDGKIIVAGHVNSMITANDLIVIRYHPDGTPDSTFANNGVAYPGLHADDDAALAMALQADGKIVTAGYMYNNFTYADNLVVRFDSTGALDNSFNGMGIVVSNPLANDNISYGVLVQTDGKIITTGRSFVAATQDFMLSRFHAGGSVDASFGISGYSYTPIAIEDDFVLASTLQSDGKILVTGYYTDGGIENFVVARYQNDSSLASSVKEVSSAELQLWPQPASDLMYVGWSHNGSSAKAEIFSVDGALLDIFHLGSGPFDSAQGPASQRARGMLNVSAFPPGMYFLRIVDNRQEVGWRKFVVQR